MKKPAPRKAPAAAFMASLVLAAITTAPAGQPGTNNPDPAFAINALVRSSDPEQYLPELLKLPATDGIVLYIGLSRVNPAEGTYDWSLIDRTISLCKAAAKPLKLVISGGRWVPAWIFDKGAAKFEWTLTSDLVDPGSGKAVAPIPWDPVYLQAMEDTAKAAAARYAGNTTLKEVQVTGPSLVNGLEMDLNVTPGQAAKMGYAPEKLIGAWEHMVDVYAEAFPQQAISLALNNLIVDQRTDTIARAVRDYAIQKYGTRVHLLVCYATDEPWFSRGNSAVDMWVDRPHQIKLEAQLIDLYTTKNAAPRRVTGATAKAVALGASQVEIFAADILNDAYRSQLESLQNAFQSNK
jgi:hypothetical protein